jgi:hypothetical protein
MATVNLGAIKFNWKGAYNNATAYVADDVVSSGGNSYVCILASTGNAVSNGTYWSLMAQAGTNGTDIGTTITTQGDILYRDGSGLQRLAKGTAGQVLKINSGATAPEWGTDVGGSILQIVQMDIAKASGSTTHNQSDSVPTTSNGTQIGTQAIVMADNSNKVLLAGGINGRSDTGNRGLIVTIFRGSTNIGIFCTIGGAANEDHPIGFSFLDAPATAGSVTYSVRAMCGVTGSWFINDQYDADDFGGAYKSAVTLSEVNV